MSRAPRWLDRLSRATDYRELQEVFAEILTQAQRDGDGDNGPLVGSIDEAVRRLETERARDQRELAEVQSRYDSFRDANKGIVGWFKRHFPFTETRRQEHEHRAGVGQQTAEILADNLVIARAQMLKERRLGEAHRKLGGRPDGWRSRLDDATADGQLAPLGQVLKHLDEEGERAHAFLDALRGDIDAFAGAEFKTAEDRRRRDDDLTAARRELDELAGELKEKTKLKRAALQQLASRAAAELEASDDAFRTDGRLLGSLSTAHERAAAAHTSLGKLTTATLPLGKLSKELNELPAQTQQLRDEIARLEHKIADAAAACAKQSAVVDERRARVDAAKGEADQAQGQLAGARKFYDAYVAECRAKQTMPVAVEAGPPALPDSPLLRQFNEAKAAADAAQAQLRMATAPYDSAKRELDSARSAETELKKQLDGLRDKLQALERETPQLRSKLNKAADDAERTFAAAAAELGEYLAGDQPVSAAPYRPHELSGAVFGWLGSRGLDRGLSESLVHAERDHQRHLQAVQVLERVTKWLDAQRQAVEQERTSALGRRNTAWTRRCTELVGDRLAKEACADGLGG